MAKRKQDKPMEVSYHEILTIAKRFGLTNMESQGMRYFICYWGGDGRMNTTKPYIAFLDNMKNNPVGQIFYNPVLSKDGNYKSYNFWKNLADCADVITANTDLRKELSNRDDLTAFEKEELMIAYYKEGK